MLFYKHYLVRYLIALFILGNYKIVMSMEEFPIEEQQEIMEPLSEKDLSEAIIKGTAKPITKEDLANYPNVMGMLPQGYTQALLNYLNGKITVTGKAADVTLDLAETNIEKRRQLIWGAIVFGQGLFSRTEGGYLIIKNGQQKLFKGERAFPFMKPQETLRMEHWANMKNITKKDEILGKLLQDYKIHLMPKGDMVQDLLEFLMFMKNNPYLQDLIHSIKLAWHFDDEKLKNLQEQKNNAEILPKFVIYVATQNGKNNTQILVDAFYKEFGNKEGLNVRPRFNRPVTSYLYFAQGNADDKLGTFDKYFEGKYKIYFDKKNDDIIAYYKRNGIDINTVDFHIKNPNPKPPKIK